MNTAKEFEVIGNNIDISKSVQVRKKDRLATNIVSDDEFIYHSADALTSPEDINKVIYHLYGKGQLASLVFFVVGINTGYRPVDILAWRWIDIIDSDGNITHKFVMPEHKTGKTATVNLNDSVIKLLAWYLEHKMLNDPTFTYDSFVFSTKGRASYVYYDKANNQFWHTDKKHRAKGLMFAYTDKGIIVCDENEVVNNPEFVRLRKPIDTDTLSKHFTAAANETVIDGHYSSYTIRQTFSYWFRQMLRTDETLCNIADEFFSTMLLSNYFQHSSLKITQAHYMRDQQKMFAQVIGKMNLGNEAIEEIVNENKVTQTTFL